MKKRVWTTIIGFKIKTWETKIYLEKKIIQKKIWDILMITKTIKTKEGKLKNVHEKHVFERNFKIFSLISK